MTRHRWHFFRAGGVDQVSLRDGADLLALRELDQKLWVALAMPSAGVDIDPETLALIDLAHDGRIRVRDILETLRWIEATFQRAGDLVHSAREVELAALRDPKVIAAARRMLSDLDRPDATAITVDDTNQITRAFADTLLNGDGIVIAGSTDDPELKRVIVDGLATVGGVTDRSGQLGLDQARADALFAAVDARVAWLRRGREPALAPVGEHTAAAAAALRAVRAKLDDYFTRCRLAAFDPRAAAVLGGREDDLVALAARTLSLDDEQLARLPIARIDPIGRLPLTAAINPAWAARLATFVSATVTPVLGERDALTAAELDHIADRFAGYEAWRTAEPVTAVDALDAPWLERLAEPGPREAVRALIAADLALADEYEQITSVAKAVRLQRDFGRLLRNFVNFSDFYASQDGAFQAGTLYLDARALHLCVPVADAAKHAALAASSDSYLIYCDITREGETRQIAAALTNGDADNMFVGRNGIFYDRQGRDWDATVVKLVSNPISIRQAFWTPYKKLVRTIEDSVAKRLAAADAESAAKLDEAGKLALPPAAPAAAPAPAAPAPPRKIDLGTVAALGVAIGGIGTLVGALLGTMFSLGPWLPIGVLALLLLISGPSMVLAALKLRRRNLGPILDANGWAINGRARINVAFGAAMTELARLPPGSQRALDDPYADYRTPWKRWALIFVVVALGSTWIAGKLDDYLPSAVRSTTVLGRHAPAAPDPPPASPAPGSAGSGGGAGSAAAPAPKP